MDPHASARLLNARKTGTVLERDSLASIADVAAAYQVQRDQIALSGEDIAGWKLGATSPAALELLGLAEPFSGPVSAHSIFESGDQVPLFASHGPMLETEFAVILGDGFPDRGSPYSRDDVLPRISAVRASMEIVAARMEGGFPGAGHLVIADHGVNAAVILGEDIPRANWTAPGEIEIALRLNGAVAANGTAATLSWDHIFDAVAWLANRQDETSRPLRSGDVIMSGTCTGVTAIQPGDRVEASFGTLGSVRAGITAR